MGNGYALSSGRVSNVSFFRSMIRWLFSAMSATALDFFVLTTSTELLHIHYVASTALGALSGGVCAFLLGRNWAFFNRENGIFGQAGRYIMTNFGSICLNTLGVYLLTEVVSENHYLVSKVIIASMIGLCYNFPMQRYFVFIKKFEQDQ